MSIVIVVVTMAVLATTVTLVGPSSPASGFGDGGPDTNQVIREGQVIEITDTTVRIREWAGVYTYRLTPTGWQTLRANRIRVGDRV